MKECMTYLRSMELKNTNTKQRFYPTLDLPPSTPIICPVIQELSSDNKNLAKAAESFPSPTLFRGCCFAIPSAIFGLLKIFPAILDLLKLGAIQLTLTLGANSAASETVRPSKDAFTGDIML